MDGCATPAREGQNDDGPGQDGAHEPRVKGSRACERGRSIIPWSAQGKKKTPVQIVISTLESADDGNMSGERAGGHRAEAW
jgi:hypothetical protein